MTIFTFYSLTSLSSLIVILMMALCVPVFILCGIATPLFGAFKLVDAILNLGIPYARYIGISGIESPALVFILSIIVGVALYLIGRACWKLLIYYIKGVSKAKQHLSI